MACEINAINAVAVALEQARTIVTISHRRPDGDTIGSALALAAGLEARGKNVRCFCVDAPSSAFSYLSGFGKITSNPTALVGADVLVVLDSGDLRFVALDGLLPKLAPKPMVVNIDHHCVNERFGDINLVDDRAASTTEVVFGLFKAMKLPITPEMATSLLTGIVTDTMLFFNPATTASALQVAAELERLGGDMKIVSALVSKHNNVGSLVVWGKALERLKFDPARSRASTVLKLDDFADQNCMEAAADGLSNFLNNNLSAKTVLVLRELSNGQVKGSLRTAEHDVDVSQEAVKMGGGGHRKAAGYVAKGQVVEKDNEWTVETGI
jgi:bifunctional oligoribonuclease and PAP phosphatase NrnA